MNESKSRLVVEIDTANAKRNADEVGKALSELSSKGDKAASAMVEMSKDVKTTATANSQLKAEVDKSTKALSQNTEVSKRNSNALRELAIHTKNTLLASTALAGGVGGLTTVLGQAATDIDRYSKLTQMSTDEFQYFALGAAKAGYSMDSYAMALKDVYDRLGDVTDAQSGEMMDFFTNIAPKIGLTTDAFKDLSGQEALQLYYNSLKQLNLPHAEMVKYMEQLIDDGTLLMPLLENNGAGFKKYGDEAQRAGAIMSGELINGLNEVNANLNSVKIEALGFANTIAGHALPAVKLITANLDTLATVGGVIAALYGGRVAAAFALSAQKTAWNTAALVAQTSATNAATVAARGLYTALGGPVGLVVSIATVAAGYLMMRDSTEAANDAMEANARYSAMATSELIKLEGAQKRAAQGELADSVDDLSTKLKVAQNDFKSLVEEIYSQNKSSKEAQRIWAELTTNVIDADEAVSRLNKLGFITPQQINSLTDGKNKIDAANQELKQAKIAFDAVGNAASGSVGKINDNTNALQGNENAARNAANALSEYAKQAQDAGKKAQITNTLISKGYSQGVASDLAEVAAKNGKVTASEAAAIIYKNRQIERLNSTLENQRKQQQEVTKSSKDYEGQLKKSAKEVGRTTEEVARLVYEYSSSEDQKLLDLENEIAHLRKNGMEQYISLAQNRHDQEAKLIKMQFEYELVEHRLTEEQKLRFRSNIREQEIKSDALLTKEQREQKLKSLTSEFNHELALIKLAQETRIFYMKQALMTETSATEERYRLERESIARNSNLTIEQRKKELALSKAMQQEESRQNLNTAIQSWGQTQANMNGTGDQFALEQDRFDRYGQSQKIFDNELSMVNQQAEDPNADMQLIAQQREEIWQAHTDRMKAIDEQYYADSYSLQLAGMRQIASGLTSIMGDMAGEQSAAYKAMFAIEKGFAIAQSALAIQTGISKAIGLGFPQNIPVIAQTVMEGAKIASAIKSITDTGFAGGGFTGHGGKYEIAGFVHKGEGVLPQEEIRAIGGETGFNQLRQDIRNGSYRSGLVKDTQRMSVDTVRAVGGGNSRSSSPFEANISIVVENHSKATVDAIMDDERRVRVIIRDEIDKHMPSQMQNPNSRVHKSITQNTTATTKR